MPIEAFTPDTRRVPSACLAICPERYGETIAEDLGISYDGMWDHGRGERFLQFTDWETGGTFLAVSSIDARTKLMRMKVAFKRGLSILAATVAIGCGSVATAPVSDPEEPVTVTIQGPDHTAPSAPAVYHCFCDGDYVGPVLTDETRTYRVPAVGRIVCYYDIRVPIKPPRIDSVTIRQ